ncbi:unnamed protein product, partial [marine sediment metagenome]
LSIRKEIGHYAMSHSLPVVFKNIEKRYANTSTKNR